MPIETTDVRSNPNEQIAHAAKSIGKSVDRAKVFLAIHTGKKRYKTVAEIVSVTGLSRKRVLEEAVKLYNDDIVSREKLDGELAYMKDKFLAQNKARILRLAGNPRELELLPTKANPRPTTVIQHIAKSSKATDVKQITINDIESFSKVKGVVARGGNVPMEEKLFKRGLKSILEEEGEFQDWGGESDDLFSTRLVLGGSRKAAAFGLKGRGTGGILYPRKMGKRGDQIQRLFRAPASVFIVQYWGQIDESVLDQMKNYAEAKSAREGTRVYYGIIDGRDTALLISGYSVAFSAIHG